MNTSKTSSASTALITRDYKGMTFTFREDGYFNMTKAAAHFGKRMDNFFANEETRSYIEALDKLTGKSGSIELIQTKMGRNGGTFAHPKLAVFFARWLDVRFAIWCDAVIEDILTGKADLTITQPEVSATVQTTQAMGAGGMQMIGAMMQTMNQMFQQFQHQEAVAAELKAAQVEQESRLKTLEMDVQFSAELIPSKSFIKQFGIHVVKDKEVALQQEISRQAVNRGIPRRHRMLQIQTPKGVKESPLALFQTNHLVELWEEIRFLPSVTRYVAKDTNCF